MNAEVGNPNEDKLPPAFHMLLLKLIESDIPISWIGMTCIVMGDTCIENFLFLHMYEIGDRYISRDCYHVSHEVISTITPFSRLLHTASLDNIISKFSIIWLLCIMTCFVKRCLLKRIYIYMCDDSYLSSISLLVNGYVSICSNQMYTRGEKNHCIWHIIWYLSAITLWQYFKEPCNLLRCIYVFRNKRWEPVSIIANQDYFIVITKVHMETYDLVWYIAARIFEYGLSSLLIRGDRSITSSRLIIEPGNTVMHTIFSFFTERLNQWSF